MQSGLCPFIMTNDDSGNAVWIFLLVCEWQVMITTYQVSCFFQMVISSSRLLETKHSRCGQWPLGEEPFLLCFFIYVEQFQAFLFLVNSVAR